MLCTAHQWRCSKRGAIEKCNCYIESCCDGLGLALMLLVQFILLRVKPNKGVGFTKRIGVSACLISINPIAKCKDLLQKKKFIIIIIIIPVMVGVTEGKTKETQKQKWGPKIPNQRRKIYMPS